MSISTVERFANTLRGLNPLINLEVSNYNIYSSSQWIDLRGVDINSIKLPPGAFLKGNDVLYNGFSIHLVPLPAMCC